MSHKPNPVTEEAITQLFYSLTGTPPPRELTEAQKESRLKERAKGEIQQAKEEMLMEQLARALGFATSSNMDIPEKSLSNLFEALR